MFRLIYVLVIVLTLSGCSTQYANRSPLNEPFPMVKGNTLEETPVNLPTDLESPQTLLLIGYRQNAQFDIDRWLIGLNLYLRCLLYRDGFRHCFRTALMVV